MTTIWKGGNDCFYPKDEYPSVISNSIVQASTAIQIAVASQSLAISLQLFTTLFYSSPKTTHGNNTLNPSSSPPKSAANLSSSSQIEHQCPSTANHHTNHSFMHSVVQTHCTHAPLPRLSLQRLTSAPLRSRKTKRVCCPLLTLLIVTWFIKEIT